MINNVTDNLDFDSRQTFQLNIIVVHRNLRITDRQPEAEWNSRFLAGSCYRLDMSVDSILWKIRNKQILS